MSILTDNYTISAFKHSSSLIKGISTSNITPGVQLMIARGSGAVDPSFVGVGQISAEIGFETSAIKTALAGIGGISGAAISNDTFFLHKMVSDGLRGGTSAHIKAVIASGLIVPTRIRAAQGQQAVLGYRAIPRSADGTTSPIAFTAAQSLETGQDAITEIYTMGPVTINATQLEGVSLWELDFGIDVWINIIDGNIYPTGVGVTRRNPIITVTSFDVGKFSTWDLKGIAQGETDSTIVLHDQAAGGVRGSSPITFTMDAGMAHFSSIPGTDGEPIAGQVIITPVYDGTNAILAVSGIT